MPYLSLSQLQNEPNDNKSFDFIVVGAGSAGCPLASRLSEDPNVTVLLIEAGPRQHGLETELNCQVPAACAKLQMTAMDWGYFANAGKQACLKVHGGRRSYWPRGKGLGGCSLINFMAYVRGFAGDYNAWDEALGGNSGWSAAGMSGVFQKLEQVEAIATADAKICDTCRGRRGPLGVSVKHPVNKLAAAFIKSALAVGNGSTVLADYNCFCVNKPTTQISNSGQGGVVSLHQQTVRQGTRCHTARAYLEPLMSNNQHVRPNLYVLTGVQCQQVATKKNPDGSVVTTGVQVVPDAASSTTATPAMINCNKEVILSGGALGSPQILLQSGIGPNGTTLQNAHVGQHLTDHLLCMLRMRPKSGNVFEDIGTVTPAKAEGNLYRALSNLWETFLHGTGLMASSAYDASWFLNSNNGKSASSSPKTTTPDLQVSAMCSLTDERFLTKCVGMDLDAFELTRDDMHSAAEGMAIVVTLLQPKSRGSVRLNNIKNNDNHNLQIDAGYFTDADDLRRMVVAIRQALALLQTNPLANIVSPIPAWPTDLLGDYKYTTNEQLTNPPDDAFLETYLQRYASTIYHPMSTCRMGNSSQNSVVDKRLRVWGVSNLRIADASIAPRIVSGNTNAVCIAIGEKAAQLIQQDYGLTSNPTALEQAVEDYEASLKAARRFKAAVSVVLGSISLATVAWFAARVIVSTLEK